MTRFPRPSTIRRRGRNRSRQVWTVIGIGLALGIAALATDEYTTAKRYAKAAAMAQSDEEIYTGSILYMPDEGKVCRQLLFDNHNGRFSDNGYVDCERASYQGSLDAPKQWSAARLRVISTGFLQH
jgi:hypothetical protein